MEIDLVEIAELTRVDTFMCLDFREAGTGPREGPVRARARGSPPSTIPPTSARKTERALPRKMFKLSRRGDKPGAEPPHYCLSLSVPGRLPPASPLPRSPLPSFLFYPLLSFPLPLPWLHLFLFDLPFLMHIPALCGCAEIEDSLQGLPQGHCSGEGVGVEEQRVCIRPLDQSFPRVPHT